MTISSLSALSVSAAGNVKTPGMLFPGITPGSSSNDPADGTDNGTVGSTTTSPSNDPAGGTDKDPSQGGSAVPFLLNANAAFVSFINYTTANPDPTNTPEYRTAVSVSAIPVPEPEVSIYQKSAPSEAFYPVVNEGMNLDAGVIILRLGESEHLSAYIPTRAAHLSWIVSDTSVISLEAENDDALITGLKCGTTMVAAYDDAGGCFATCLVTVIDDPIDAVDIDIEQDSVTLPIGARIQLNTAVNPVNADDAKLTWQSSDTSIATVSVSGAVTAKKPGTVRITATAKDGKIRSSCTLKVAEPPVAVTSVTLDRTLLNLTVGDTAKLNAVVRPADASDQSVAFAVSDASVASVSADGVVTAKAPGKAYVTVTTLDGGFSVSCTVNVTDGRVPVTSIVLEDTLIYLNVGSTFLLNAEVRPANADNKAVVFTSSDANIAGVNADGMITAKNPGKAYITASALDNGMSIVCTVNVGEAYVPVRSITLDRTLINLKEGETTRITASIDPENATNPQISYWSDDSSIADVDENGVITAKKAGKALITASAENLTVSATVNVVSSYVAPTAVVIDRTLITLTEGEIFQLSAEVRPANVEDPTVVWTSDKPDVASVDGYGVVTAKKAGKAYVTAATADGKFSISCTVNVDPAKVAVNAVVIDKTLYDTYVGDMIQIRAEVRPANAENRLVVWTVDRPDVVSVDQYGVVTALKPGKAYVTVTTVDGGYHVSATINVAADRGVLPTALLLEPTLIELEPGTTAYLRATVNPSNAVPDGTLVWSCDDPKTVTVDQNGLVTAKKAGKCIVRVSTADGKLTASCSVIVPSGTAKVQGVELSPDTRDMSVGEHVRLVPTVTPSNAVNTSVTWSSSNENVASVDAGGNVNAVSAGEAWITATTLEGGFTDSVLIRVSTNGTAGQNITLECSDFEIVMDMGRNRQTSAAFRASGVLPENYYYTMSEYDDIFTADPDNYLNSTKTVIFVAEQPGQSSFTIELHDVTGKLLASCTVPVIVMGEPVYEPAEEAYFVCSVDEMVTVPVGGSVDVVFSVLGDLPEEFSYRYQGDPAEVFTYSADNSRTSNTSVTFYGVSEGAGKFNVTLYDETGKAAAFLAIIVDVVPDEQTEQYEPEDEAYFVCSVNKTVTVPVGGSVDVVFSALGDLPDVPAYLYQGDPAEVFTYIPDNSHTASTTVTFHGVSEGAGKFNVKLIDVTGRTAAFFAITVEVVPAEQAGRYEATNSSVGAYEYPISLTMLHGTDTSIDLIVGEEREYTFTVTGNIPLGSSFSYMPDPTDTYFVEGDETAAESTTVLFTGGHVGNSIFRIALHDHNGYMISFLDLNVRVREPNASVEPLVIHCNATTIEVPVGGQKTYTFTVTGNLPQDYTLYFDEVFPVYSYKASGDVKDIRKFDVTFYGDVRGGYMFRMEISHQDGIYRQIDASLTLPVYVYAN